MCVGESNLEICEEMTRTKVVPRGTHLKLVGSDDEVRIVAEVFQKMRKMAERGLPVEPDEVAYLIGQAFGNGKKNKQKKKVANLKDELDYITASKLRIFHRSDGQRQYIKAMMKNAITFCIGPEGTWKTYLAFALAVKTLTERY